MVGHVQSRDGGCLEGCRRLSYQAGGKVEDLRVD